MNERIKLLAEQAGFIDRGSNHTSYMSFDHEKFAELIVHDCLDIVDREVPGMIGVHTMKVISEHFGVE